MQGNWEPIRKFCILKRISMPVSEVNSEEACQIAVSQAMKHMRPDSEPELLNVEDNFASEATRREVCMHE